MNFKRALKKAERDIYIQAYKYHALNQAATAKSLGVARNTLRTKLKSWGVLK